MQNHVAGDFGKVYLGDDKPCNIMGKGDMKIKTQGFRWCLKDLRHVPKMKTNLISIVQLRSAGYVSTFTPDT